MPYIMAALVAAIALTGWLLKGAWEDNAEQAQTISTLTVERDSALTEKTTLDQAVTELRAKEKANAKKLATRLTTIREVKDEDNCLDRPVPSDIDRLLNDRTDDASKHP